MLISQERSTWQPDHELQKSPTKEVFRSMRTGPENSCQLKVDSTSNQGNLILSPYKARKNLNQKRKFMKKMMKVIMLQIALISATDIYSTVGGDLGQWLFHVVMADVVLLTALNANPARGINKT